LPLFFLPFCVCLPFLEMSSIQTLTINDPTNFRNNIVKKIQSTWAKEKMHSSLSGIYHNISVNVEKGIFNFAIREAKIKKIIAKWENPAFVALYISRLRSVVFNLEDNPELMHALNSGDIEVPIFSKMTHQEFQPEKWKDMIERRIMKNASKYEDNMQASTDMFTCRKCRSKRCTYYEMQTRSADEPSTIFITCLNCGKNWRQ